MKVKKVRWVLLAAAFFLLAAPPAFSNDDENVSSLSRGFSRVFQAPFQLPFHLIHQTLNEPPILGTVDGALTGSYFTIQDLTTGTFDIIRGALPYAQYLIFFL